MLNCGSQQIAHRLRDLRRGGLSTEIPGVQRGVRGNLFDCTHHLPCNFDLAQMFQQHHHRPERPYRIGQTLAHDVKGRTVDGFEH